MEIKKGHIPDNIMLIKIKIYEIQLIYKLGLDQDETLVSLLYQ